MGYGARIRVVAGVLYNAIADENRELIQVAAQTGLIEFDAVSLEDEGKLDTDGMLLTFCQGGEPGAVLAIGVEIGKDGFGEFYDNEQGMIAFPAAMLTRQIAQKQDEIDQAFAYIQSLPDAFRNHPRLSKFDVWVVSDVDE